MSRRDDRRRTGRTPYRDVVTTPYWPWWAWCTVGARLPVAMAPLALILLGRQSSGGYALGGLLVAAHTLGEAVCAPAGGAIMDRWSPRRALSWCLGAEAALFALLAVAAQTQAHAAVLLVLAALAGAVPAGAPGGLRALLAGLVGRPRLAPALSIDTVINQACWTLGPIVVTGCTALASASTATGVIAAVAGAGALAANGLPATVPSRAPGGGPTVARPTVARPAMARPARSGPDTLLPLLRLIGRNLALTAVLRLLLGTLTAVAAPLFADAGGWWYAGVALAAYAFGTAVGSMAYSSRSAWPADQDRQADVVLVMLGVTVAAGFLVTDPALLILLYGCAGILEGPVVVARSLHLESLLPEHRRATGFSLQYAAIGWGFAAGGLLLAQLIDRTGPHGLLLVAGAFATVCATLAVLAPAGRAGAAHPGRAGGRGPAEPVA